jgi:hypothetical protein
LTLHRWKKIALVLLALAPALFLTLMNGCSPSEELGGVAVVNALPDTRISGTPPVLEQTKIIVDFFWTGNDPDGTIQGYQWKMSSNGIDGINVRDTLTVDPATGDTLNPWYFTVSTDTTFIVTADSSGFHGDALLPEDSQRFFQPHTLFVRAVDEDGGVDPSPAMITFTATTLSPRIRLTTPVSMAGNYAAAKAVPPTFILGWTGTDPDFETNKPTKIRYLLKEALLERTASPDDDLWINTRYKFDRDRDDLVSLSEPGWSDWFAYENDEEDRRQVFTLEQYTPEGVQKYYLFAMQAQDTAGAVSLDLTYARTVHNFRIDDSSRPVLTVRETFLGESVFSGTGLTSPQPIDIAQNQPLEFVWSAEAEAYGGLITAFRYGWNVQDLDFDEDPGWQIGFGMSDAHRESQLKTFDSGLHTLTVEALDNSGQKTRAVIKLSVVPVPERGDQSPVLLIDDVLDHNSGGWADQYGNVKYDEDNQRDSFWEVALDAVSGWSSSADVFDVNLTTSWGYREAVNYRVLMWAAKIGVQSFPTVVFDPPGTVAFVWLETYMSNVGNVFMAGSGAMQNFHQTAASTGGTIWLYPIIYDTDEDNTTCNGQDRALSFGWRDDEDDNVIVRGREKFPYRAAGMSMVNLIKPPTFWRAASLCGYGVSDAKTKCVGTKAVILDPDFRDQHQSLVAVADTIYTWETIDHVDVLSDGIPSIQNIYNFGGKDEFYDFNVTTRSTNWVPQLLEDGTPVIEPMWRGYSRYDWILDRHIANGNTDYPDPDIDGDMVLTCGAWAINPATGRTRVDGVPLGVFSHNNSLTKPGNKADVFWGFDPSRMDHDKIIEALHWVLEEHFELDLN